MACYKSDVATFSIVVMYSLHRAIEMVLTLTLLQNKDHVKIPITK